MTSQEWSSCPVVSVDPQIVHGEPVFVGSRVSVTDTLDSYYAYLDEGLSDDEAVEILLESFPTIPSAEALRGALAFEAKHAHQFQP